MEERLEKQVDAAERASVAVGWAGGTGEVSVASELSHNLRELLAGRQAGRDVQLGGARRLRVEVQDVRMMSIAAWFIRRWCCDTRLSKNRSAAAYASK